MENKNRNNLLKLMEQMRSLVPPEETPSVPCEEIVWSAPRHFGIEPKNTLTAFSNKLAALLQKTLQSLCDDSAEVSFDGLTEHFTSVLSHTFSQERKNRYYLQVNSAEKDTVGFLEFPFETATNLIGQMLKNPEAQIGQNGELSSLEESILLDVAQPLLDSLIEGFIQSGSKNLIKAEILLTGETMDRFDVIEDMCELSFKVSCDSTELTLSFYLLDELIDPLVGITGIDRSPETLKQMPERVVSRTQQVSMDVTARLSTGMINFQDLLSLQKDDVIVLDRKVSDTAEILVNDRHCFDAWPARHAGFKAVVIAGQKTEDV